MMDTEITALIDEQDVIDNLDIDNLIEMSNMSENHCKDYFGNDLLKEFTIEELIEHHGAEEFLRAIGIGEAIKYFDINIEE